MKVPYLNQRGVTLVEVLATLVLLTFVGGIAYSFLINSYTFQERTSERVSIVQESNILSTSMRQIHEQGGDIFFTENGQLRADSSTGRILHDERTRITNLTVDGEAISPGTSLEIEFDQHDIEATILNGQYTHTIDTTLERLSSFSYQSGTPVDDGNEVTPPDEEPEVPDVPEEPEPEEPVEEPEPPIVFPPDDETDKLPGWNNRQCSYTGDVLFRGSTFGSWEQCEKNYVYSGSMYTRNSFNMNDGGTYPSFLLAIDRDFMVRQNLVTDRRPTLFVGRNFYAGQVELRSETKLDVLGSTVINGNYRLQERVKVNKGKNLTVNNKLHLLSTATLDVGGNTTTGGELELQEQVRFTNNGDVNVGQAFTVRGTPTLNVGGNFTVGGNFIVDNNPTIFVNGNATFNGETRIQGSPSIKIKGNGTFNGRINLQTTSKIEVDGDLTLNGDIAPNGQWNTGTICVKGDLILGPSSNNRMTVKESKSCGNDPNTIIVIK